MLKVSGIVTTIIQPAIVGVCDAFLRNSGKVVLNSVIKRLEALIERSEVMYHFYHNVGPKSVCLGIVFFLKHESTSHLATQL